MTDLVEFLLAEIAEDERIAQAVTREEGADWRTSNVNEGVYGATGAAVAIPPYGFMSDATGAHIACHDPSRVLAECNAKRRVIEAHEPYDSEKNNGPACWTCGPGGHPWPCETLRLLALAFEGRPGYQETWAPE